MERWRGRLGTETAGVWAVSTLAWWSALGLLASWEGGFESEEPLSSVEAGGSSWRPLTLRGLSAPRAEW